MYGKENESVRYIDDDNNTHFSVMFTHEIWVKMVSIERDPRF